MDDEAVRRAVGVDRRGVGIDMSGAAVTARLREMAELLARRGFVRKGVDMSPAAVTARLRVMGALSDMCRRLTAVGKSLRPPNDDR